MKNKIFIKRILILLAIVAILALSLLLFPDDKVVVKINDTKFFAELVDTVEGRAQGLSDKESLGNKDGMLFVFENDGLHGIWMKDMNFPIDILWIDKDLKIVDMKQDVKPESYPEIFRPKTSSLYIIEINSGFVKDNNITFGDEVVF